MPAGSRELENTRGVLGYAGPRPPAGSGAHPYVATLYALDVDRLPVADATTLESFIRAIKGHVLLSAQCTGYFETD
jgi:phosphatidylethanolamine-binding protein (PEBP) family uncharacterized protein